MIYIVGFALQKCESSVACLGASTSPILVLDTNVVLTQVIFVWFLLSTLSFQLLVFYEMMRFYRLVCLRILLLMTWLCYQLCWMRLRTRTYLFTTELELSAAIPCGDSLFSLTSTTSMLSIYAFYLHFRYCCLSESSLNNIVLFNKQQDKFTLGLEIQNLSSFIVFLNYMKIWDIAIFF